MTIKGAPDTLLDRCNSIVQADDGQVGPLDQTAAAAIRELKDQWSSNGKRVILLARKMIHMNTAASDALSPEMEMDVRILREASNGLTFVGTLALVDPARSDIPEVMRTLRGAGIRTFMVCAACCEIETWEIGS